MDSIHWPYSPTLVRLALAIGIGLFVGIERERRRKEAGLRTFAFAGLLGAVGGLLGQPFALTALALLGILVVLLNVEAIRNGEGAEITTSTALFLIGFAGVLIGQGHTFTPTVIGVATAALLAWKEPLAGFSQALTESELKSAVLLAILSFVIYPVLPDRAIDPWGLISPRAAWATVILVAALGFANYLMLKIYGRRGVELTGFFGGLVNSTVTVTELAARARSSGGALAEESFRGIVLATVAMLVRNAMILGFLAPGALVDSAVAFGLMTGGTMVAMWFRPPLHSTELETVDPSSRMTMPALESPFSLRAALKFGAVFVLLHTAAVIGQRTLGRLGFYAVSVAGGAVSSASAVASAANLSAGHVLPASVAGRGAIIASVTSAFINLPIVVRVSDDPALARRVGRTIVFVMLLGIAGSLLQLATNP